MGSSPPKVQTWLRPMQIRAPSLLAPTPPSPRCTLSRRQQGTQWPRPPSTACALREQISRTLKGRTHQRIRLIRGSTRYFPSVPSPGILLIKTAPRSRASCGGKRPASGCVSSAEDYLFCSRSASRAPARGCGEAAIAEAVTLLCALLGSVA